MVLSMERWKGKVAVVTGASSGIGSEIVKWLLNEGVIVVGMARRKELIQQISSSKNLHSLKVDIRSETEIIDALNWVKTTLGSIHILVNSAGTLWFASTIYGDTKLWKDTFDTDVFGLLITTKEVVKEMISNNIEGHIIHISGISGHGAYFPHVHAVGAAKSAVTTMTEDLRRELIEQSSKIKITNIALGVVDTDIFTKNIPEQPELKEWTNLLKNEPKLNVSDVAEVVVYVLSTAPHVQIHNIQMRPVGATI